ncbi:MAG: hypothetical protein KDA96_19635 [Planctomycetaceae bacterium]|nr:hypothetical protein [Planctomycetaceae bacterium]
MERLEDRSLLAAAVPLISIDGQAPVVMGATGSTLLLALTDSDSTRLFTSDGTQAGTTQYADIPALISVPFNDSALLGTTLIFAATGSQGSELWKTDGTAGGTGLVADINPGATGASPAGFTVFAGDVYFAATTDSSGRELWKTNGTTGGTAMVADLVAGAGSSRPGSMIVFDGQLFFSAFETDDIYRTNGTAGGTVLVVDGNFSTAATYRDDATAPVGIANGRLFVQRFEIRVGATSPFDLYQEVIALDSATDTTPGVMYSRVYANSAADGSDMTGRNMRLLDNFETVNNRMVFRDIEDRVVYDKGGRGALLLSTNGVDTAEVLLTFLHRESEMFGPASHYSGVLHDPSGDVLVLYAIPTFGTAATEGIWRTDGTVAGTVQLANIRSQSDFLQVGPEAYFLRRYLATEEFTGSQGTELWSVRAITGEVQRQERLDAVGFEVDQFTTALDQLFFSGPLNGSDYLWTFDETAPAVSGPQVTSPTVNSFRGEVHPTFSWQPVANAVGYELRIYGQQFTNALAAGGPVVFDEAQLNHQQTSYVPSAPLKNGGYDFQVRALLADGTVTSYTVVPFYVTLVPANLTIVDPNPWGNTFTIAINDPNYPSSGMVDLFSTYSGAWYREAGYTLQGDPSGVRTATISFLPQQRPSDGKTTIRVRSHTVYNVAFRNFEVDLLAGPTGFSATWSGNDATVAWQPASGAHRYDVWIDDFQNHVSQLVRDESHIGTSITSTLPPGNYRMWVRAINTATNQYTHWSSAFVFTNGTSPWLYSPAAEFGDGSSSETFEWGSFPNAAGYQLWVSDLNTGTRIIYEPNLAGDVTSYTAPFDLGPSRYACWVRARYGDGSFSPWSSAHAFTIQPPPLQFTAGLAPSLDFTPTIEWESPVWADTYELWISVHGLTAPVYRRTGLTTGQHELQTALVPGTNYDVWVRGFGKNSVKSPWGTPSTLRVSDAPPALISPKGPSYPVLTGRQLTWIPPAGATSFDIWVDQLRADGTVLQFQIVRVTSLNPTSYQLSSALPAGRYRAWVRAIHTEPGATFTSQWSTLALFSLT